MFIKYDNKAVRLTGRWYKEENAAVTSACGSKIEFSFYGKMAVMHFNMEYNEHPYPHLWIQTDGGVRTEAAVDRYLRIYAEDDGPHNVSVIYKSGMEMQQRWYDPLVGKIAFMGFDAEKPGAQIFVLGTFCGWCHEELADLVDEYNMNKDSNVVYINTYGWIPAEPLHPGRDGHKIVAEKLIKFLSQYVKE